MKQPYRARMSKRRRYLAIHEAAHAVVAEALGLRVRHVSIDPECMTYLTLVPATRRWYTRNAIVACAGFIAESRVTPDLIVAAGQDGENAQRSMALFYGEAEVEGRFQWAVKRAERLVHGHWLAIERVAARLLRSGTLDGKGVRACIDG